MGGSRGTNELEGRVVNVEDRTRNTLVANTLTRDIQKNDKIIADYQKRLVELPNEIEKARFERDGARGNLIMQQNYGTANQVNAAQKEVDDTEKRYNDLKQEQKATQENLYAEHYDRKQNVDYRDYVRNRG